MADQEAAPEHSTWTEVIAAEASTAVGPRRAELHRLADASRLVTSRLMSTDAPIEVLTAATEDLLAAAARFEGYRQGSMYEGFSESANAGGDASPFFDHSPMLGKGNPIAPP